MRRVDDQSGVLTAFLAVLAVGLFALAGLVIDGGRALAARQQASTEAEQAARFGAEAVSETALRLGTVQLNPVLARQDALFYVYQIHAHGTVIATTTTVTVTIDVDVPTTILGIVGIRHVAVSATASVSDVHGVSEED